MAPGARADTTTVLRSWIACLLIAAATALVAASPARADDRNGRLHFVDDGVWTASGSLDRVRPGDGDGDVRSLHVDHLGPNTEKGLAPLTAFPELRHLEIDVASGVDLAPLAELNLETLALRYLRDADLTPLGAMPKLRSLILWDLRNVHVPSPLTLAPSLSLLIVGNSGWRETGAPVKALIDAVDWTRLGGLRSLGLDVGGELEPVRVDLGLLRSLPRLVDLRIESGVHHRGELPSPLAPPFDGLAAGLRSVRIDAWRPAAVERALQRRYPRAYVGVMQRYPYDPRDASWTLLPPTKGIPDWSTYGSLWEAFDGRYGLTENEALLATRRRLRRVAPALLKRLDFDQEADGTGIGARRRRDLVRALRILGIR